MNMIFERSTLVQELRFPLAMFSSPPATNTIRFPAKDGRYQTKLLNPTRPHGRCIRQILTSTGTGGYVLNRSDHRISFGIVIRLGASKNSYNIPPTRTDTATLLCSSR